MANCPTCEAEIADEDVQVDIVDLDDGSHLDIVIECNSCYSVWNTFVGINSSDLTKVEV
jgi:hypothetical protein